MNTPESDTLTAALYELGRAMPLDADRIEAVVRRYPEHADEIRAAAVQVALDEMKGALREEPGEAGDEPSPAVVAALARFHAAVPPPNPFAELDAAGARRLAQDLGASTLFVMKLRDRRVRASTIPAGFVAKVAALLQRSVEALEAHFAGPPLLAAASYKSAVQPEAAETQSFEEAARSSGLDEAQVRTLLAS